MRMIVWSKGQALSVLSMLLGLTMGITALILASPTGQPPEEEAVVAFAAGSLFTEETTPAVSEPAEDAMEEMPETGSEVDTVMQNGAENKEYVEELVDSTDNKQLQVEIIRATPAPETGKSILIYHTHTWEAFAQVEEALYVETEKWRTKDNGANVVAVGIADEPGSLANVFSIADENGINIEYVYAFISHATQEACIIMRVAEGERAAKALIAHGVKVLSAEDVYRF